MWRAMQTTLMIAAVAGCSELRSTAEPVVVRDSAGIEIVESSAPVWQQGGEWRLSAEPTLQIGVSDGAPELQFDRIAGVRRLPDGRILVGDGGSVELRVFRPDGTHELSVGRKGRGPAELTELTGAYLLRGDSIAGRSTHQVIVFAPDGRFVRKITPDRTPGERFANLISVLDDGTIVSADFPEWGLPVTGVPNDSLSFYRHAPTGELHGRALTFHWMQLTPITNRIGRVAAQPHLSSFAPFEVKSDATYVARLDGFEIHVFDSSGVLRRSMRRRWEMLAVTEAHRERYAQAMLDAPGEGGGPVAPRMMAHRRERLETVPFASYFPPVDRLLMATDGHLWARHVDPEWQIESEGRSRVPARPSIWSVFDAGGRWLGEVEMPAWFQARSITGDEVLGVWMDENDVQYVRVYGLVKPTS